MTEFYLDPGPREWIIGRAALEQRLYQSDARDLVPLSELLTTDEFPFQEGDFEPLYTYKLTREDFIALAQFAVTAANDNTAGKCMPLSGELLNRGSILGLTPSAKHYLGRDLAIRVLARELDVPTKRAPSQHSIFKDWTVKDYAAYAALVIADNGGEYANENAFRAYAQKHPDAPTLRVIERNSGGIIALNDMNGFPNVKKWGKTNFVSYGAQVAAVNGEPFLTPTTVTIVARRRRGPSHRQIIIEFGSWDNYKKMVAQSLAEQAAENAIKASTYRTMATEGRLPKHYATLPQDALLSQVAGYRLLQTWPATKQWPKEVKIAHAARTGTDLFIPRILRAVNGLAKDGLERVAERLGILDEILPPATRYAYLRVSPEEYSARYQEERSINKKHNKARAHARQSRRSQPDGQ